MSEHTRLSLPNLATVNDHQIERVIPTRRELILSNLLRAVAAITNFQPFAKLRIYLDTFDVASLLLILVYNTIVFFSLCNGGCLSNASQKLDEFVFLHLSHKLSTLLQTSSVLERAGEVWHNST